MTTDKDNQGAIDIEPENETPLDAIALRVPSIPTTITEISSLGKAGLEVIQARHDVMESLRAASIKLTRPEDWLLFKDQEGRVTCYLQDSGCDRVAPLWGISVFNIRVPERIGADDGSFVYSIKGDGRCALTGQVVLEVEGMRSSKEKLVKDVEGAEKEYLVRKCARANLDGSIVRELAGMKNMPLEELKKVVPDAQWEARAAKGKGYGNQGERQASREGSKADVPKCPKCSGAMWDNRGRKTNPNAPDFKCKDKANCGEGVWEKPKGAAAPASDAGGQGETTEQSAPAAGGGTAVAPEQVAAEKTKRVRSIKAQFKGRQLDSTKQNEYLEQYFDSAGLEGGDRTLENLGLDMLIEINEDLKKPSK